MEKRLFYFWVTLLEISFLQAEIICVFDCHSPLVKPRWLLVWVLRVHHSSGVCSLRHETVPYRPRRRSGRTGVWGEGAVPIPLAFLLEDKAMRKEKTAQTHCLPERFKTRCLLNSYSMWHCWSSRDDFTNTRSCCFPMLPNSSSVYEVAFFMLSHVWENVQIILVWPVKDATVSRSTFSK